MAVVRKFKELESPLPTIVTITPDMATRFLVTDDKARERQESGHGYSRRPMRSNQVETYARDMKNGVWHMTGEAIKFGIDGSLLDGQHRLQAVVRAGVPVTFLVIEGLDPEVQKVMDTGAKRTPADALRMRGEVNATKLAAIARMILTDGSRRTGTRPSTSELFRVIDEDPYLLWVVNSGVSNLYNLHKIMTPAVLGYSYWLLHQVDEFDCSRFFIKLSTLADLPEDSPILALNRRLTSHKERRGDSAANRREAVACIVMAWNAFRKNEPRAIIKLAYVKGELSIPTPI